MGKVVEPLVLHVSGSRDPDDGIAQALLAEGFQVKEAQNGAEALSWARRQLPRLVIINNWADDAEPFLRHRFKAEEALAGIPLLIVAQQPDGLRETANGYLLSPATPEEVAWQARTLINLSEREQSLQTQSRRQQHLLNAFPGLVYYLDDEERYQFVNQSYEKWHDFAPQQVIGNRLRDTIGPGYSKVEPYLKRARAGESVTFEDTVARPAGPRILLTRYLPESDTGAPSSGVLAVITDVTEQKQAATALHESEEMFRALADTMPLLIWVADSGGQRTFFNQRWLAFTGRSLTQESGMGWTEGIHPADLPAYQEACQAAWAARQPFASEYRISYHDGTYRWLSDNAAPRFAANGDFTGFIGSCLDITERRQAEAEREQLLLSERQARAEAEAANRAKEEFASVLSHELRSPLNAIYGWARLLQTKRQRLDEATLSRAIDAIERSARAQAKLIEDLLDAARLSTGKLQLFMRPVDLAQVIQKSVENVRPAALAGQISLTAHYDNAARINGDTGRLQQIIDNLLTNALKFTPAGGRVVVRLATNAGDAQITVEDTGQGITAEFLPQVFDYFVQTDASNTRRHGGLGLGLALVGQLVKLHGGTVAAASAGAGQGATFTVTLPLGVALDKSVGVEASSLAGLRILIVDDEEDARAMLNVLLAQYGAQVNVAASAQEALQWLAAQADAGTLPDLIVSDISMPQQDGYMLLQQLRAWPPERGGNLPAIALTALTRPQDRQKATQAGFQDHLAKPVQPELLLDALLRLARASSV